MQIQVFFPYLDINLWTYTLNIMHLFKGCQILTEKIINQFLNKKRLTRLKLKIIKYIKWWNIWIPIWLQFSASFGVVLCHVWLEFQTQCKDSWINQQLTHALWYAGHFFYFLFFVRGEAVTMYKKKNKLLLHRLLFQSVYNHRPTKASKGIKKSGKIK